MYASRWNWILPTSMHRAPRPDRWRVSALVLMLAAAGSLAQDAAAEEPLSAIDWLSKSVAMPQTPPGRPPITSGGTPGPISVAPIGGTSLDAIGLLPVARTGLPRDLWGPSPSEDLARLLTAERVDTLPAMQQFLTTLLLAELAPPADSDRSGKLFLARVDKLLDMGALEPALSLL